MIMKNSESLTLDASRVALNNQGVRFWLATKESDAAPLRQLYHDYRHNLSLQFDCRKVNECLQLILDSGLQASAQCGYIENVKCLVELGANVNADNLIALHDAIQNKHTDTITYLIGLDGLQFTMKSQNGQTPYNALMACKDDAFKNNVLIELRKLPARYGDSFLNSTNNVTVEGDFKIILSHIIQKKQTHRFKEIYSTSIVVLQPIKDYCLRVAAAVNAGTICTYLLSNGANVLSQGPDSGNTALHFAIQHGCIHSAEVLLNAAESRRNLIIANKMDKLPFRMIQELPDGAFTNQLKDILAVDYLVRYDKVTVRSYSKK
jgi:ankyrin repeat protein